MPVLTLLSREGCGLCEDMLAELNEFCGAWPQIPNLTIQVQDVDQDDTLRRRFGHHIPVLLLDDQPVCRVKFDAPELARLLKAR
jgi:hypothetical protein